VKVT